MRFTRNGHGSYLLLSALATWAGCRGSERAAGPAPHAAPELAIPARSEWRITASGAEADRFGAALAIDGDARTRWSSPHVDPQWIEVDMARPGTITGFTIAWEAAYARKYEVLVSVDGEQWQSVFENHAGDGNLDDIYILPVLARHVRIRCLERGTAWGYSILELQVKGPGDGVVIAAPTHPSSRASALMDGDLGSVWKSSSSQAATIRIDLRAPRSLGGVRIDWGENHARTVRLQTSRDGTRWTPGAELRGGTGQFDVLPHRHGAARYLAISLADPKEPRAPFAIRDISLRGPEETLTPFAHYQIAAQKSPLGHYPGHMLNQQVYWTIVGVPGDSEESLLDEYGNLEPRRGATTLMPYIYMDGELRSAFDAEAIHHALVDGYIPIPSVTWSVKGLRLHIQAYAAGAPARAVTHVRYALTNNAAEPKKGELLLAIRPVQINPLWQHGGLSPITQLALSGEGGRSVVLVNGQPGYLAVTPPDRFGAQLFDHGDVVRALAGGGFPSEPSSRHDDGLVSGALGYGFELAPGQSLEVILAAPLHGAHDSAAPAGSFDSRLESARLAWKQAIDRVGVRIPQPDVGHALKAQIGYILLNQDGVVIQPGSRNYNRTWIRDGSMTSAALLRMGVFEEVRAYIDWYAQRVQPNGLVPPILNNDGSIYEGWGSNIEWDSQGQFIYAVMEYYRFTRDEAFLRRHFDAVHRAMQYLVELRSATLDPGYKKGEPGAARFRGILPPSISHEGYTDPAHSYWDDWWAIRGWKDGIRAARILQREEVAQWAQREYESFAHSLRRSIQETIAFKRSDYIPSSADYGDADPTSVAIALFPTEAHDVLPRAILERTFEEYFRSVRQRQRTGRNYKYTPYEIRNILALARLGLRREAYELHNILFGDRRPREWQQFAEVVHSQPRLGGYIGDMPHTWVGSGYVNSVRGMIVQEDGARKRLVLLYATPREWLQGEGLALENAPTHFGSLTMTARLAGDTLTVDLAGGVAGADDLELFWPVDARPISVHVDGRLAREYGKASAVVPPATRQIVVKWAP